MLASLRPRHDYAPNAATNRRAGGLDIPHVLQRVSTKADTIKDLLLGPRSCTFDLFLNCCCAIRRLRILPIQMLQLCPMSLSQRRQVPHRPPVSVGLLIARRAITSTMLVRRARSGIRIATMKVSAVLKSYFFEDIADSRYQHTQKT